MKTTVLLQKTSSKRDPRAGRPSLTNLMFLAPALRVTVSFICSGFLKPGAHVKPGETFTYKWTVPESVSPTVDDPPCLTYLYFSAVEPIQDTSAGLVGPLLVCKKGALNADGTQVGHQRSLNSPQGCMWERAVIWLGIRV